MSGLACDRPRHPVTQRLTDCRLSPLPSRAVREENRQTFPFGAPVLPRPPSSVQSHQVYLLGAYPSGLHVRWTAPDLPTVKKRTVQALLVDNEPTPFWNGAGQGDLIANWQERVSWQPDHGEVRVPRPGVNGPSGSWVEHHILQPLGLSRDDVSISDCLDTARLNSAQERRIKDTYEPVAGARGLPSCTVWPVPVGENGIVREARENHLDRLRSELATCEPSAVITLGNAALRVFTLLAQVEGAAPSGLEADGYGTAMEARIGDRAVTWMPLVHPRSGERTPAWTTIHQLWREGRPHIS